MTIVFTEEHLRQAVRLAVAEERKRAAGILRRMQAEAERLCRLNRECAASLSSISGHATADRLQGEADVLGMAARMIEAPPA